MRHSFDVARAGANSPALDSVTLPAIAQCRSTIFYLEGTSGIGCRKRAITGQAVATYRDHIADTIVGSYDSASGILDALAQAGVDLDDVAVTLEHEGIASFEKNWNELIASVEKQLESAGASVAAGGAVSPASSDTPEQPAPAAAAPLPTARDR